jgi:hypothetical protein
LLSCGADPQLLRCSFHPWSAGKTRN